MKERLTGDGAKLPSPFDASAHKTERSGVAVLMHWMRDIIEAQDIDLGLPDVETGGRDRKMPDTVIYESRTSQGVLCVLEAKPPYFDVFAEGLKDDARKKANKRRARYFATTNFKHWVWWKTRESNDPTKPEEEQIVEKYELSAIEDLNDLDQARFSGPTRKSLAAFLEKLQSVVTGKETEPKQAVDDFLIFRLQEKISVLSRHYREIIEDRCHKDTRFAKTLGAWFRDQGWSFTWQRADYDKAARQTAYLLVNKIVFYDLLQAKRPHDLDVLEIPAGLSRGAMLEGTLQNYFDQVLKIDYETIYTADFIDQVAFPDSREVVQQVKELVSVLKRYDFSKLGFDIIGRVFERLIPDRERHNLGQYFTSADVVDLILSFCLQHENDKIMDPACGAGTFLVRSYQHKRLMNQRLAHDAVLESLWGVDIAKFPAHLATINLAINDLASDKNYPNILNQDFFSLNVGQEGFDPVKWRTARAKTLGLREREVVCPRWFDAIVGNPPYTRQEEIGEMAPEDADYKQTLIENALLDVRGRKLADITRRAGIHAYFFVHGTKLLREGGRFGFIVSNSWLDADFGCGLQEFLLANYKIVAVIESKVERWFEQADVNTCIVILEKCSGESAAAHRARDDNRVRFVCLKKPLRHFIPLAQDMWEKQVARLRAVEAVRKTILAYGDIYENDDLRIFPKLQGELRQEGIDRKKKVFVGAKWGKYLRAPIISFILAQKGRTRFIELNDVAGVSRGFTTGADPWFYVTDVSYTVTPQRLKQLATRFHYRGPLEDVCVIRSGDDTEWLVEKAFLKPVVRNPEAYRQIGIAVPSVSDLAVFVHEERKALKGKAIEHYLSHGERKQYDMGKDRRLIPAKTGTCAARQRWYELPSLKPSRIIWQKAIDVCHRHFLATSRVLANQRFYLIYPHRKEHIEPLAALLNSALVALNLEFQRAAMGMGAIESTVEEVRRLWIPNPELLKDATIRRLSSALQNLSVRKIESVFEEIGAQQPQDVELSKVKPDRRELDRVVLGECLDLSDAEQLDVYRAVIDLARSRVQKVESLRHRGT